MHIKELILIKVYNERNRREKALIFSNYKMILYLCDL